MLGSTLRRCAALLLVALVPLGALQAQVFYATPYTFTTLAGLAGNAGSTDASGSAARFSSPYGVAVDASGNIYVADNSNHTIRKITSAGVVTTLAGSPGSSGSADGTGSAARFNFPFGVAVDGSGNVYVADYFNYAVRKITPGGVVTTLAGSLGNSGSIDGTGTAARFNLPTDVAVDGSGNVYVADYGNHTIRKITSVGVVTTLAGTAGSSGLADGTGAAARFNRPNGVAVDGAGNVYVADYLNNTIRKITAAGVVTTVAGLAGSNDTVDGTGNAARFNHPTGVAVDGSGNLFVADYLGQSIRKITTAGVVTSIGGSTGVVGSADGKGSVALFNFPVRVAVDGSGNVYVADNVNNTIRKGSLVASATLTTAIAGSSVTLTAAATGTPTPIYQWKKDGVNISGATSSTYVITSVQSQNAGNYTVVVYNAGGSITSDMGTLRVVALSGDFNGDAKTDILFENTVTGQRYVWFMNGVTNTGGADLGSVGVAWSMVAAADFNGDTKTDILWQNTVTGQRYVWLMDGVTTTSGADLGLVAVAWSIAAAADFNGDGQTDILFQNTETGQRYIWLMGGVTNTGGSDLGSTPVAWSIAAAADFNGDGKTDILLQNTVTGQRSIWLMNGVTVTGSADLGIVGTAWSIAAASDYNGDGQTDILFQNTNTGQRYIWFMNGTTNTGGADLGIVATAWSIVN